MHTDEFLLKLIILFIGILLIVLGIFDGFIKRKKCTQIVNATCIKYQEYRVNTRSSYNIVFSYRYESKDYIAQANYGKSLRKALEEYPINSCHQILLNPNAPHQIRLDDKIRKTNICFIVGGILLVLIWIGL